VSRTRIDGPEAARAFADRLDRYAEALQVRDGSALLPDVGGMLLWSHLRVYDLAGLCDASIAALRWGDKERLREVVFADSDQPLLGYEHSL